MRSHLRNEEYRLGPWLCHVGPGAKGWDCSVLAQNEINLPSTARHTIKRHTQIARRHFCTVQAIFRYCKGGTKPGIGHGWAGCRPSASCVIQASGRLSESLLRNARLRL